MRCSSSSITRRKCFLKKFFYFVLKMLNLSKLPFLSADIIKMCDWLNWINRFVLGSFVQRQHRLVATFTHYKNQTTRLNLLAAFLQLLLDRSSLHHHFDPQPLLHHILWLSVKGLWFLRSVSLFFFHLEFCCVKRKLYHLQHQQDTHTVFLRWLLDYETLACCSSESYMAHLWQLTPPIGWVPPWMLGRCF